MLRLTIHAKCAAWRRGGRSRVFFPNDISQLPQNTRFSPATHWNPTHAKIWDLAAPVLSASNHNHTPGPLFISLPLAPTRLSPDGQLFTNLPTCLSKQRATYPLPQRSINGGAGGTSPLHQLCEPSNGQMCSCPGVPKSYYGQIVDRYCEAVRETSDMLVLRPHSIPLPRDLGGQFHW